MRGMGLLLRCQHHTSLGCVRPLASPGCICFHIAHAPQSPALPLLGVEPQPCCLSLLPSPPSRQWCGGGPPLSLTPSAARLTAAPWCASPSCPPSPGGELSRVLSGPTTWEPHQQDCLLSTVRGCPRVVALGPSCASCPPHTHPPPSPLAHPPRSRKPLLQPHHLRSPAQLVAAVKMVILAAGISAVHPGADSYIQCCLLILLYGCECRAFDRPGVSACGCLPSCPDEWHAAAPAKRELRQRLPACTLRTSRAASPGCGL